LSKLSGYYTRSVGGVSKQKKESEESSAQFDKYLQGIVSMCFPIKFFLGVLASYVVINLMFAVVLYIIYGVEHPWKEVKDGDVHTFVEDSDAYVYVGVSTLAWIVLMVTDVLILVGLVRFSRIIGRLESSEETRPLLKV